MAKYDAKYLQELVSDSGSSVFLKKSVKEILLQPWHLRNIQESVAGILNLSLCKYDASLDGLLLGYQNAKRLGNKAPCQLDTSQVSVKIEAEFYIFQPKIGNTYKGIIHNLSVVHVGCLLYNHFNVSLPIPPDKIHFLKVITHQSEVTFILEEFNLTGELPFFRGQLSEINLISNQSKKIKLSLGALEKRKMDKLLNSLNLKEGGAKPDKRKRLSLKPALPVTTEKEESSDSDDSDGLITPFQRPRVSDVAHSGEETPSLDKMKSLLKSMRDSPLKGISSSDESLTDISLDGLKGAKDSTPKSSKIPQNSQSVVASPFTSQLKLAKPRNSQSLLDLPVEAKSPGSKKNGPEVAKQSVRDDSSSSSEDSEEDCKKAPVLLQSPTKQLTQKNTAPATQPEKKIKSPKPRSVLSLTKPVVQIASKTPVSKADVSSSDSEGKASDDDKSSSEDSEERREAPVSMPTKQMSLEKSMIASFATSTQKSPQKQPSICLFDRSKLDVSSSEDSSEDEAEKVGQRVLTQAGKVNPSNQTTRLEISAFKGSDKASSGQSDADTSGKTRVDLSKLLKQFSERSGNTNREKRPSSVDSTTPLGNLSQKQPEDTSDSSDSEVDAPKAPEKGSSSAKPNKSSLAPTTATHLQEDTVSDSDADDEAVAPFQVVSKTIPDSYKSLFKLTHKNPLLNQTCLDGSVQNRSPLACSTPTVVNTNKKVLLSLKRPSLPETLKYSGVKEDEPKDKKKKGSKDPESKLSDSGFKDSKVKRKKKKEENSKSSKNTTKEEVESYSTLEDLRQRTLEMANQRVVTQTAETKNPKKSTKSKTEVVTTELNPLLIELEPDRVPSKHHGKDRKKKAEKRPVEELKNVGDLEEKLKGKTTADDGDRKAKKRKLGESKEGKAGVSEDRKIQKDDVHDPKKRRLFAPKDHDSVSITNTPLEISKHTVESVVSKPKKSSKKTMVDSAVKLKEDLRLRKADKDQEKKSEPLVREKNTESGSKKKESKVKDKVKELLSNDNTMNRFILNVVNDLTDEGCDSKKKKKKKKSKNVDAIKVEKSSTNVIPPVEKLKKLKKDKSKKKDVAKKGEEPIKDPNPSISNYKICPPTNQAVPTLQAVDLVNSERKLKKKLKKEKRSRDDPKTARESSPAVSTGSAVTAKNKKTAESGDTLAAKVVSKEMKKLLKQEKKDGKKTVKRAKTRGDDFIFDLDNIVNKLIITEEKKKE